MSLSPELASAAERVARLLIERGETVGVCESAAGGLISATLLSVPGASAYFVGGCVMYTGKARSFFEGLGPIPSGLRGATEEFARFEASTITERLGSTWGIGETGAAGPSGNPYGDPAGHAWVGVAHADGRLLTVHILTGRNDRVANMEAFALAALDLLEQQLMPPSGAPS